MLRITNTLTKRKEDFIPQNPLQVSMYTCGVTVYDDCHIGHARSLYTFDVIRRYLKYRGFDVTFVRNITDIDDKIINRANELEINWHELVGKYIERYYEDLKILGIEKADYEPRATENIEDMIRYIAVLVEKGYAYESGGDVYFNVRKFPGYGKLSGQNIEEMETGTRISPTEFKKDPLDFALWKASKEGEPFWGSPWGNGRPGWHIECSVMSRKFLKTDTLDIHAGGRDLVFPHHENELAQAESFSGKTFAKYWIHHGLLTINGQKMAKSLGNFVTIRNFIDTYKNADLLKLFFLSAHYSHPIDYSEEKIGEAKKQKNSFDSFFQMRYIVPKDSPTMEIVVEDKRKIDAILEKVIQAMDNDFNTPQVLSCLFELRDFAVVLGNSASFAYARDCMEKLFTIFNLEVKTQITLTEELLAKHYERDSARIRKDFGKADRLRKEIENLGYILEDHKGITACKRKT
ncbi:MAG: cysteine--tRNA ligase [Candidatus Omnitrophota bacterium]